jgi:glycosyl transferase family 25
LETTRPLVALKFLFGAEVHRDVRWYPSPLNRPGEAGLKRVAKMPVRSFRYLNSSIRMASEALRLHLRLRAKPASLVTGVPRTAGRAKETWGLDRCDVICINLAHRSDRMTEFAKQMDSLRQEVYTRFEAVLATPGSLGCAMSHLGVLSSWSPDNGTILLVCEDDASFLAPREVIDEVVEEFLERDELSVLALANSSAWHIPISERLAVSTDVLATACYLAKPESVGRLIDATQRSVTLLRAGRPSDEAAIDVVWRDVQKELLFAIPRTRLVTQRSGYSDVEMRDVQRGA